MIGDPVGSAHVATMQSINISKIFWLAFMITSH